MKLVVKSDLRKRLEVAAYHGSIVAKTILERFKLRDTKKIFRDNINYLSSVKCLSGRQLDSVAIKYVPLDAVSQDQRRLDPQYMWISKNTVKCSLSSFMSLFKEGIECTSKDVDEFCKLMRLPGKITMRIGSTFSDFQEAFCSENYFKRIETNSPVFEDTFQSEARSAEIASFYAYVARAKIIIASDENCNIVGRAILWPSLHAESPAGPKVSCVDRVFSSYAGVENLICKFAKQKGINFITQYSYGLKLVCLNAPELDMTKYVVQNDLLTCPLPMYTALEVADPRYEKGSPKMFMLDTLMYNAEEKELYLTNAGPANMSLVSYMRNPGALESSRASVCPFCGKLYGDAECPCVTENTASTLFGKCYVGKVVNVKGIGKVPEGVTLKGKLTKCAQISIFLRKNK